MFHPPDGAAHSQSCREQNSPENDEDDVLGREAGLYVGRFRDGYGFHGDVLGCFWLAGYSIWILKSQRISSSFCSLGDLDLWAGKLWSGLENRHIQHCLHSG